MDIRLDPADSAPVYLRLVAEILKKIETGALAPGDRLPTVREMARSAGLAPGTVRHAYNALAREGAVEMAQGRGTFVRGAAPGAGSRQKQAMDAIGAMLDRDGRTGLYPREIPCTCRWRCGQRGGGGRVIPVAVGDCNPNPAPGGVAAFLFFSAWSFRNFCWMMCAARAGRSSRAIR